MIPPDADMLVEHVRALVADLDHTLRLMTYRTLFVTFVVIVLARGLAILPAPSMANYIAEGVYVVALVLIIIGYALEKRRGYTTARKDS